jgi:hypothetical protein
MKTKLNLWLCSVCVAGLLIDSPVWSSSNNDQDPSLANKAAAGTAVMEPDATDEPMTVAQIVADAKKFMAEVNKDQGKLGPLYMAITAAGKEGLDEFKIFAAFAEAHDITVEPMVPAVAAPAPAAPQKKRGCKWCTRATVDDDEAIDVEKYAPLVEDFANLVKDFRDMQNNISLGDVVEALKADESAKDALRLMINFATGYKNYYEKK